MKKRSNILKGSLFFIILTLISFISLISVNADSTRFKVSVYEKHDDLNEVFLYEVKVEQNSTFEILLPKKDDYNLVVNVDQSVVNFENKEYLNIEVKKDLKVVLNYQTKESSIKPRTEDEVNEKINECQYFILEKVKIKTADELKKGKKFEKGYYYATQESVYKFHDEILKAKVDKKTVLSDSSKKEETIRKELGLVYFHLNKAFENFKTNEAIKGNRISIASIVTASVVIVIAIALPFIVMAVNKKKIEKAKKENQENEEISTEHVDD